jgi:hypothetical protein
VEIFTRIIKDVILFLFSNSSVTVVSRENLTLLRHCNQKESKSKAIRFKHETCQAVPQYNQVKQQQIELVGRWWMTPV